MKLASGLRGASALSSLALLLSIGCGGDFRSSSSTDGGRSSGGKSSGGKSSGGKSSGGDSGSTGDDSGAGHDGSGGAPGGGAPSGGAPSGGTSGGGTAGKAAGGSANGGRAGHGNGGAAAGGGAGAGNGGAGTGGDRGGAAGGGAGGRDTSQHANDYDQGCNYDGQCSLVNSTSDACGCKTCLNDAISSGELAKWNADRKAFNCPIPICPGLPCPEMLAACAKGTCTARKPFIVDASTYDTACSKNSDCTTIPVGEMCSACQCAVGAVSLTGLQQYQNDRAKILCSPGPSVCDCAPPVGGAQCSAMVGGMGVCVLGSATMTQ